MSTFISQLQALDINTDLALKRFLGDEELFEKCIKLFADDETFSLLGGAIIAKDYQVAYLHLHTIKGVASNLGFNRFVVHARSMIELIRENPVSPYNHLKLEKEYPELLALLVLLKSVTK